MITAAIVVGYFLISVFGMRRIYAYGHYTGELKFCPEPKSIYHTHREDCYAWDGTAVAITCFSMLLWPVWAAVLGLRAVVIYKPHQTKEEKLRAREKALKAAEAELKKETDRLHYDFGIHTGPWEL